MFPAKTIDTVIQESRKSNCNIKIGSAIFKNKKKLLFKGHNSNLRTKMRHHYECSVHAEMFVLNQLKKKMRKRHEKRRRGICSKYKILVVRINTENGEMQNAMPCLHCCRQLLKTGLHKVFYSNNNQIHSYDLNKTPLNPYLSAVQKKLKEQNWGKKTPPNSS